VFKGLQYATFSLKAHVSLDCHNNSTFASFVNTDLACLLFTPQSVPTIINDFILFKDFYTINHKYFPMRNDRTLKQLIINFDIHIVVTLFSLEVKFSLQYWYPMWQTTGQRNHWYQQMNSLLSRETKDFHTGYQMEIKRTVFVNTLHLGLCRGGGNHECHKPKHHQHTSNFNM
jgi:hypothetical protein